MGEKKVTTSWMWLDGGEVRGLRLDLEGGKLRWHDEIGCHCTDEEYLEQSVGAFRRDGAPLTIGPLPDDVAAELDAVLETAV